MLDSLPAIPVWIGVLLVVVGFVMCLLARGRAWRAVGAVALATGVLAFFHSPSPLDQPKSSASSAEPGPVTATNSAAQSKTAEQATTPGEDNTPSDYSELLSMLTLRVEQELPTTLASDVFDPVILVPPSGSARHTDSDGETIPPFLLTSVDLVKTENGKIVGALDMGIQPVREFLDHGLDLDGHKANAFMILSNFPVFEHKESLLFDLIRANKHPSVRAAAAFALRHDVFDQGLACQFLSTLLDDPDLTVRYAALLALASSDQLPYLQFTMEPFPTDEILSRIEVLMHTGFQIKLVVPIARVLSRSPYIRNPMVHTLRDNLRNVTIKNPLYEEFLEIIDAAK